MDEADIINLLRRDNEFMEVARGINSQVPPDCSWCIFSGFVRNKVWDYIHGNTTPTRASDIDVALYMPGDNTMAINVKQKLEELYPTYSWDVSNFAYSHTEHNDSPYVNLIDGLSKELETITSVGLTLRLDGSLVIIAPHDIGDLVKCIIRPTPIIYANPEKRQLIVDRISRKHMLEKWPKLQVII